MKTTNTHYSIKPIDIFIDEKLFTEKESKIINGRIIAIDIYPKEAITFTILLDNGTIYNYIPVDKVFWVNPKKRLDPLTFEMKDLIYNNSLSNEVTIDIFDYLVTDIDAARCFIKQKQKWQSARYILSIDWYNDNDLLNFMKLENGQFAFLPNHKILFNNFDDTFQPYQKARWECVV